MPVTIDYQARIVRAAVGDLAGLATFHRIGSRAHGLTRRAQVGIDWHRRIQESDAAEPDVRNEVPCKGVIRAGSWSFHLEGRVDQIHDQDGHLHLREIKTVTSLPTPEADPRTTHPAWFHQAGLYQALSRQPGNAGLGSVVTTAELLLVDLRSGLRLPIFLGPADAENTTRFLKNLADLLESKRPAFVPESTDEASNIHQPRPFRPAQEIALRDLTDALGQRPVAAFEAPTGFGKTAVFVHWALRKLESPSIHRAIFLTGKRSGRIQIVDELQRAVGPAASDRVAILRSRDESRPACPFPACRATSCDPASPPVELHHLLGPSDGAPQTLPCPYQLGRASLPFAPIWIADLNYLFAESSNHVFPETPGYDPSTTVLVIDEAHNLPDRVAGSWSSTLSAQELERLGEALLLSGSPRKVIDALDEIAAMTRRLPPGYELPLSDIYWFEDSFQILIDLLAEFPPAEDLDDHSITTLGKVRTLRERLADDRVPALRHSGPGGCLRVDCTDPAPLIAPLLRSFNRVCLTSATLAPFETFFRTLGTSPGESAAVTAPPIWKAEQLDLAIDLRVDTRSTKRDHFLGLTATSISEFARTPAEGPTLVFCPSFHYLQTVRLYLGEVAPDLLVAAQDREDTDPLQTLANALPLGDIFLLVLGSRLSEGIDALGGQAGRAIIISPGIPEVSPVRRRAREDADAIGQDGFHNHFTLPGMRKVIQAVGRLIRAETHRARVVLHCRRFDQPDLRTTFPSWWPDPIRIRNDRDWKIWLKHQPSPPSTKPAGSDSAEHSLD